MKQATKRTWLLALALVLVLTPALALAASETDGAGNVFASEAEAAGLTVGGDLYSFGQNVDASGAKIAESAILAGQSVSINNSAVGGSLRAAGYQITAASTAVDVNATLAAYSIDLGQGFTAKGVYAAAQTVSFAGSCDTLNVSAQTVTIGGTVNGDVNVNAETVSILGTAVITGNLNVTAASEPSVAEGASVGAVNFTLNEGSGNAAEQAVAVTAAAGILSKISKLTMMLPGRILLAVLYYFIIRKTVDDAAAMIKSRPAAMPVSGAITLISLPIAAIILLCTYIGVPVGLLLLCLYGLALAFAVSFGGCMLGRLVFPKMHTLLAYIIGAAALTVLKLVPYLGGLVTLACMIYTLGYFIQKIYLGFGKKPVQDAAAPTAAPEIAVEAAPPAGPETL